MMARALIFVLLIAAPLVARDLPLFDICREGFVGMHSSAKALTADDKRWVDILATRVADRVAAGALTPSGLWQDLAAAAQQRHIGSYSEFERLLPRAIDEIVDKLRLRAYGEKDRAVVGEIYRAIDELERTARGMLPDARASRDRHDPDNLIYALAPELTLSQVASLKAVRLLTRSYPGFIARMRSLARPEYFARHEAGDHFAFEPLVDQLLGEFGMKQAGPFERDFLRRCVTSTLVQSHGRHGVGVDDLELTQEFNHEVGRTLFSYQINHERSLKNRERTTVRDGNTYLQIPIPVRVVDEKLAKEFRLIYSGTLDAAKHLPPNGLFDYSPMNSSEVLTAAKLTEKGRAIAAFGDIATHSLLHLTARAPVADFISVDPVTKKYYITEVKSARETILEEQLRKAAYQLRETAKALRHHLDGAPFPIEGELSLPEHAMPLISRDAKPWRLVDGFPRPNGSNEPVLMGPVGSGTMYKQMRETGKRKYAVTPILDKDGTTYHILCEVRDGNWEAVFVEGAPVRIIPMKRELTEEHRRALDQMRL